MAGSTKFGRKNIRLDPAQYRGLRSYFITFCCDRRRRVFADGRNARWLIDVFRKLSTSFKFAVHAYCVMPDHFHFVVTGTDPVCDLLEFTANLKESTTGQHEERTHRPLWQKKFHDHILRRGDKIEAVAGYIWMNPVRAGLCVAPQEYPYSGSFVVDWKKMFFPAELWEPEWKKKRQARLRHMAADT